MVSVDTEGKQMSLKDQIQNHSPESNRRCVIGTMLSTMTDDDREAFNTVAPAIGKQNGYTYSWLRSILANEGYDVAENTLRRHLTGNCICR